MFKKYISIFLFLFSASVFAQPSADMIPERPSPPKLVNNLSKKFPNFLSSQEEAQLENKLSDFANATSNQIAVVIVDDLAGLEAWDYATRLGHKWGVGQGKFDNGVVVLIKPTGEKGQRDAYIAVGYGLGGAIPDATANQIIDNELGPGLASGDHYGSIDKATNVLMSLAKGEYSSDAYGKKRKKNFPKGLIIPLIFIILFIILRSSKGGRGGGGLSMGTGFLLGSMFRGGGGFGGGGSSGGFGGFGGGGFGGGGAGGKW